MKKISSLILIISLAFTMCFGIAGCGINREIKWDGLTIAKFDSYEYLGVASVKNSKTRKATAKAGINLQSRESETYDEEAPTEGVSLAGITSDGKCEKVRFKSRSGKIVDQDANLIRFDAYSHYSFAVFSNGYTVEYRDSSWSKIVMERNYRIEYDRQYGEVFVTIESTTIERKKYNDSFSGYFFIIDNSNGNIYDMHNIASKISQSEYRQIINIYPKYLEYDYILFTDKILDFQNNDKDNVSLYEIRFNDDSLTVRERMNPTQVRNFGLDIYSMDLLAADKFGNVFKVTNGRGYNWIDSHYRNEADNGGRYQKCNGEFDEFNFVDERYPEKRYVKYPLGFNGILYRCTYDLYNNPNDYYTPIAELATLSYLNEDGEFVQIDSDLRYPIHGVFDQIDNYYTTSDELEVPKEQTLIYHADNVYYFGTVYAGRYSGNPTTLTVSKVTLSNERYWDFTVETYELEHNTDGWNGGADYKTIINTAILYNDKLYSFVYDYIVCYDLKTGEKNILLENDNLYRFYYDKNLGIIRFTIFDNTTLLEQKGYINQQGELIFEEFDPQISGAKKIYIITPLNK